MARLAKTWADLPAKNAKKQTVVFYNWTSGTGGGSLARFGYCSEAVNPSTWLLGESKEGDCGLLFWIPWFFREEGIGQFKTRLDSLEFLLAATSSKNESSLVVLLGEFVCLTSRVINRNVTTAT